ncbi:MAG: hypothetical protein U5K54_26780 [Cytophagales bacterium]|nr:hypothetical protein [Cytophagales bacterium]
MNLKNTKAINQELSAPGNANGSTKKECNMEVGHRSLYASPDPYSGYASWMLPAFSIRSLSSREQQT